MINLDSIIIITGAAGFIGSCLASHLKSTGYNNLLLVDDFSINKKSQNTINFSEDYKVNRDIFIKNISDYPADIIIHLGARTDTTEMDFSIHEKLNLEYSKKVWNHCTANNIKLIYASSAATYGGGENGYSDNHQIVDKLKPLNPYGESKQLFDQFALKQNTSPPAWHGLKFFNVYGPNEYHKGRMASVILHTYNQIKEKGEMKLFRSHNPDFKDGEQKRDFVYVKDVISVIHWLMKQKVENGLYNLGSGQARTFLDLVRSVFQHLDIKESISFIDTPEDIREKYQYFTEADMSKLKNAGYRSKFHSLEEGVKEYVQNYLSQNNYF